VKFLTLLPTNLTSVRPTRRGTRQIGPAEINEGRVVSGPRGGNAGDWTRLEDIRFLTGEAGGYDLLNLPHHRYSVRTAAIHPERRSQRFTCPDPKRTILAVWKYLAGYSTFAEAYENDEEDQMFTPQGVTKVVRVDDGDFEWKAFVADIGGRFLS